MRKKFTHKNSVSLIKNGPDFINKNIELIQKAEKYIFFHTYIFEEDNYTTEFLEALIEKSMEGVSVFIILDAFGSPTLSSSMSNRLKKAGVKLSYFTPLFSFSHIGRRLHQKVLIIDLKYVLLGGINYAKKFNSPSIGHPWLDYACLCEGEVANDVFKRVCYLYQQKFSDLDVQISRLKKEVNPIDNTTTIYVSVNDWMRYKQEIYRDYIQNISTAKREIFMLATYFIPGKKMLKELKKASKRGVKIHLIFGDKSDLPLIDLASDYFLQWYLDNNIHIYKWHKSIIHGKIAIIDGNWGTVGSYNHNYISQYGNLEINLNIIDEQFNHSLKQEMLEVIRGSTEITESNLNRNLFNKIRIFLVYVLTNIIILFSVALIYKRKNKS